MNLDDLNPEQRDAVLAPDGPILILAGAGSGKTRVLTYRIAHLLAERKAAPSEMLAVTFTNKAAGEMRERVAALVGDGARCRGSARFIRPARASCARKATRSATTEFFDPRRRRFDDDDSPRDRRGGAGGLAGARDGARANRAGQERGHLARGDARRARSRGARRSIAQIYRLYHERLRAMNAMDFSDLQLRPGFCSSAIPEVLVRWQWRAEHLLVDEYQDTNRVQYLMVQALSARIGKSVRGRRRGSIDLPMARRRHPQHPRLRARLSRAAQIFKLEQNYRSTKTILAAADAVIRNNRERKVKNLWTENAAGEPVTYYTGVTERDEADFIAREIARLTGSGGFKPADVVVFYRVNAQSRVIEEALVRRRIPYYVVGGVRFYEQRDVKDLLAYLRVIANPADAVSLERMVGTPTRGIGAKSFEAITELAARQDIPAFEAMGRLETYSKVALRIAKQAGMLYSWMHDLRSRAAEMSVRGIVDEVMAHSGFEPYLDTLDDASMRKQNVAEMLSAANAFDAEKSRRRPRPSFSSASRWSATASRSIRRGGRAALMTLHTSKGLEYPVVFIAGMEEGLFPHSRSADRRGGRGGAPAVLRRHDARAPAALPDQHAVARALRRAPGVAAIAIPARDRSRPDSTRSRRA